MEDDAFNWYRDNRGPYTTWLAFRQALEQTFPTPERTRNRHSLAEQISQKKQGSDESVRDYFYSLDKLCREYNPGMSPMDKAIKLVSGLREDLKEKTLPMNVQTPEEFMIQAKNFESSQKVMANHRKQNGSCELAEPTYDFEPSDYPIIATAQSYRQEVHHQNHRINHYQNKFTQPNSQNLHQQHRAQDRRQSQDIRNRNQSIQQSVPTLPDNRYSNNGGYFNSDHWKCFRCGKKVIYNDFVHTI